MALFYTYEKPFLGIKNRILQSFARSLPGGSSLRVKFHRWRGVGIGNNVFIGLDVILDTSTPEKILIGNDVIISMRTTLIAHHGNKGLKHIQSGKPSIIIEDKVFIGPGVLILPDVKIGEGAVISAGTVITRSVPPRTMMQGNPAKAVAHCGVPLLESTPMWEFYRHLKPIIDKKNL